MTDIIGPADAPNFTTSRPADDRTIGATDTWMKDCTGPTANDGTKVKAAWLNAVIGLCRSLIRGNGNTGAGPAVVTEDNADDMALRAIQHLIQRGQTLYGVDSGSANALVVSLTPALAEYKAGTKLRIKAANNNTNIATLNVNALGAKSVVRRDGTALLSGDIIAGAVQDYVYDGTKFQMPGASAKPIPSANLDLYVNTTLGNDANDGGANLSGRALKTIQAAVTKAFGYEPSQFTITIHVADGTYAESISTPSIPGPSIIIDGNVTTPANVLISSSSGSCFTVRGPNAAIVKNLKYSCSDAGSAGLAAEGAGATLQNLNTESGAVVGWAFLATSLGNIRIGTHKFTANTGYCFGAYQNGLVSLVGGSVYTISTTITVTAFATVVSGGGIVVPAVSIPTFVNAGNVTGLKYSGRLNGVIDSQGFGGTYFPGTSGSLTTGAQYA